ncbi:hypothetical protein B0H13DRAFT_1880822 [Mycena leptocephala]|nr:hypothetical protein B0H13DRAFT_1880822 [Mycena leptocephala]
MTKSVHKKAVWVNHQRTERNVSGHCLALVLEWMVDLVVGGVSKLAIARNGKGAVMAIEGFSPMKKPWVNSMNTSIPKFDRETRQPLPSFRDMWRLQMNSRLKPETWCWPIEIGGLSSAL